MKRLSSIALLLSLALFQPTFAHADDAADISAARKFVATLLEKSCDFTLGPDGTPEGLNEVFQVKYRRPGQDQDSPDNELAVIQLHCMAGAYNYVSVYVTKDPASGTMTLVNFAEPKLEYDYTDETFTRLKAPPRVVGFTARPELTNSEFDPETLTITATPKWRGIGDAGSSGEWQLVDGVFVLRKYEVDPTYQAAPDADEDPDAPESYVVYDAMATVK